MGRIRMASLGRRWTRKQIGSRFKFEDKLFFQPTPLGAFRQVLWWSGCSTSTTVDALRFEDRDFPSHTPRRTEKTRTVYFKSAVYESLCRTTLQNSSLPELQKIIPREREKPFYFAYVHSSPHASPVPGRTFVRSLGRSIAPIHRWGSPRKK